MTIDKTTNPPPRGLVIRGLVSKQYAFYLNKLVALLGAKFLATKPVYDKNRKPTPAYVAQLQVVDGRTGVVLYSRTIASTQANNLVLRRVPSARGQIHSAIVSLCEEIEKDIAQPLLAAAWQLADAEARRKAKQIRHDRGGNLGLHSLVMLRASAKKRGLTISVFAPSPDELNPELRTQMLVVLDAAGKVVEYTRWPYFDKMRQGDRKRRHQAIMALLDKVNAMPEQPGQA